MNELLNTYKTYVAKHDENYTAYFIRNDVITI